MDKGLKSQLVKLDRTGFRELELAISIARRARQMMHEFNISVEEFAKEIQIKESDVVPYTTGAYKYSLRDMARLDAYAFRLVKDNIEIEPVVTIVGGEDDKTNK